MTTEQFISEIAKHVQKYAPKYNIKVYSPIIAQAILESGRGTSELAVNANNYFGLKYRAGRCPTACGIYYKVGSEQNPDGSYTSSAMQWMKFPDMENGVIGYFDFINTSNYSNLKGVTDPETYLKNIKADGYATSLNYADNVMAVIKSYNLTQYDSNNNSEIETSKKYYRVQTGAFSNKSNAESLQRQLKNAGFDSIIKNVDGLYKCQVGAFSNKANAEMYMDTVKQKGFSAFVTYC